MSRSTKSKSSKQNTKKKHHTEQWDDLIKLIRALSRDAGLSPVSDSNYIIQLVESYSNAYTAFPPRQIVLSETGVGGEYNNDMAAWVKILASVLISNQCTSYTLNYITPHYTGLRSLCCWGVDIGDFGAKAVFEAMPLLTSITKCEMIDCNLGYVACSSIASYLKHRRTSYLEILRLDHNTDIGDEGVRRISEGLNFNSNLRELSMAHCGMTQEAGKEWRRILATKDIGIRTLSLEGNDLSRSGIIQLSAGLACNRSLTSLNLAINRFGVECEDRTALGSSTAATSSISSSSPSSSTSSAAIDIMQYLSEGIMGCKTLKSLNIDGNLIGDSGVSILYHLAIGNHLQHIMNLDLTPFVNDSAMFQSLMEKVESNRPVKVKKKGGKKDSKKKKSASSKKKTK